MQITIDIPDDKVDDVCKWCRTSLQQPNFINGTNMDFVYGKLIEQIALVKYPPSNYPKATELGPTEHSRCPHCNNSFDNAHPDWSPSVLRRCANCKELFVIADTDRDRVG